MLNSEIVLKMIDQRIRLIGYARGRVVHPNIFKGWFGLKAATIAAAVALAGCADTRIFENRLMCNLDGSGGVIVSRYGGVGIASNIADEDIRRVCAAAKPGVSQ